MRVVFIVTEPACECGDKKLTLYNNKTILLQCQNCGWSDSAPVREATIVSEHVFGAVPLALLDGLTFTAYCAEIEKEEKVPE